MATCVPWDQWAAWLHAMLWAHSSHGGKEDFGCHQCMPIQTRCALRFCNFACQMRRTCKTRCEMTVEIATTLSRCDLMVMLPMYSAVESVQLVLAYRRYPPLILSGKPDVLTRCNQQQQCDNTYTCTASCSDATTSYPSNAWVMWWQVMMVLMAVVCDGDVGLCFLWCGVDGHALMPTSVLLQAIALPTMPSSNTTTRKWHHVMMRWATWYDGDITW